MNVQQVIEMPMRETLDKLAEAAAELNSESDQLNEVIADFESELERAGVGVTYWSRILLDESGIEQSFHPHDEDELYPINMTRGWLLGFAKLDGRWCVAVKPVRAERQGDDEKFIDERKPVPLMKAPRIVRIEGASRLETLAIGLTLRVQDYTEGIAKAKKLAKS